MTALPDSDAATSLVLNCLFSKTRRIASATAAPSMIAPSTMLSGGTGWMPKATTFQPLPACLSSTAFTALEPMSRPMTALDFPRPNTTVCPLNRAFGQSEYQTRLQARPPKSGAIGENCDHLSTRGPLDDHSFVSDLQNRAGSVS